MLIRSDKCYDVGQPKSSFGFFHTMALVVLVAFNFIQNNCVRLYCDSCHSSTHLKTLSKSVNFYIAILILKMEENMQHFQYIMLYYFKKGKNTTEVQKKIAAVYGEGAVTDQTCHKWFAKVHAGDFSSYDAPRLGRPVEVYSEQIETLTENNQCSTTQEIAHILKTSTSVKLLVKMKICLLFYRKN